MSPARKKAAAKSVKATEKSTEKPTVGQLVPQPHGGALRYGGTNAGGTGRPPDEIRAAMRGTLSEILPGLLEKYTKGEIDHVRFADFLAKYGLGTKDELSVVSPDVVKRLEQQVTVIMGRETWTRDDLLAQLSEVWT